MVRDRSSGARGLGTVGTKSRARSRSWDERSSYAKKAWADSLLARRPEFQTSSRGRRSSRQEQRNDHREGNTDLAEGRRVEEIYPRESGGSSQGSARDRRERSSPLPRMEGESWGRSVCLVQGFWRRSR